MEVSSSEITAVCVSHKVLCVFTEMQIGIRTQNAACAVTETCFGWTVLAAHHDAFAVISELSEAANQIIPVMSTPQGYI